VDGVRIAAEKELRQQMDKNTKDKYKDYGEGQRTKMKDQGKYKGEDEGKGLRQRANAHGQTTKD